MDLCMNFIFQAVKKLRFSSTSKRKNKQNASFNLLGKKKEMKELNEIQMINEWRARMDKE